MIPKKTVADPPVAAEQLSAQDFWPIGVTCVVTRNAVEALPSLGQTSSEY